MNTSTSKTIYSLYKEHVLSEAANVFDRQKFLEKLSKKSEIFRDTLLDVATRIDMSEKDQADAIDELFVAAQENINEFIVGYKKEIESAFKDNQYSTQGLVDDLNTTFSSYLGKVAKINGPNEWKLQFPSPSNYYPQNKSQQQANTPPTTQQPAPPTTQQPAPPTTQQPAPPAQAFNPPVQNSTQTTQPLTPSRNVPGAVPLNPSQPLSQQQLNPFTGQPMTPAQNTQNQSINLNPFANTFKPGPGSAATYAPKSGPLTGTQQPVYPTRNQAYAQKEAGQAPLANTGNVLADFNRRRAYLSGRGY